MEIKQKKLDELIEKNPFVIPEGYFEGLTAQIMAKIPEETYREAKIISLRDRIRPWLYLAGVFAGLLILFKVFINPVTQDTYPSDNDSSYLQALVIDDLFQVISDDDLDYLEFIENQYISREFAEGIDNMDY